ncbi:MAG TPA: hypothetical protein VE090_01065, partial [Methylomirabilota bacterium]|nr:hypothetical protein [Methylomirabilota bacterium]
MKKIFFLLIILSLFLRFPFSIYAASIDSSLNAPHQAKVKGHILDAKITTRTLQTRLPIPTVSETLQIRLEDGNERGKIIKIDYISNDTSHPVLVKGDEIILGASSFNGENTYYVIDKYRTDKIIYIVLSFIVVVLLVTGKKGLRSLLGLIISLLAVFGFVI